MTLRVARHTNDLQKIETFYKEILGFEILGGFQNHSGYDGVFIGIPELNWHFEFTQSDEKAKHIFDEDDIIVLYPNTLTEYKLIIDKISRSETSIINPKNSYWNDAGKMILDPDGYRIVISDLKIKTKFI